MILIAFKMTKAGYGKLVMLKVAVQDEIAVSRPQAIFFVAPD